jgi:hypothetical protein
MPLIRLDGSGSPRPTRFTREGVKREPSERYKDSTSWPPTSGLCIQSISLACRGGRAVRDPDSSNSTTLITERVLGLPKEPRFDTDLSTSANELSASEPNHRTKKLDPSSFWHVVAFILENRLWGILWGS